MLIVYGQMQYYKNVFVREGNERMYEWMQRRQLQFHSHINTAVHMFSAFIHDKEASNHNKTNAHFRILCWVEKRLAGELSC